MIERDIGGGIVTRTFRDGAVQRKVNDPNTGFLTVAQIMAMPAANRQALIDKKYIAIYPRTPGNAERFVVSAAFGKFDVIEGVRVTDAPVAKDEAYALAGIEMEAPAIVDVPKPKRKYTRKADK